MDERTSTFVDDGDDVGSHGQVCAARMSVPPRRAGRMAVGGTTTTVLF
jgi:hypothetical protein